MSNAGGDITDPTNWEGDADETISVDTQLVADKTVSGTLHLANGATLDLNGHNLTVNEIASTDDDDVPCYKFPEYIKSDGNQWLCSDYTPASSDRVMMKFVPMSFPAGAYSIYFCSRGSNSINFFLAGIYGASRLRVDHKASSGAEECNYSFSVGSQYDISVDGESGDCMINDTKVLTVVTEAYEIASGSFSILGAHSYGASLAEHKGTALTYIPDCGIYSFQVYDKNDECKCDIVPARRTSDGAIGMYDKARNSRGQTLRKLHFQR